MCVYIAVICCNESAVFIGERLLLLCYAMLCYVML